MNKKTIFKKINENKNKIKSFGVKHLWLFGSYARDEQTKDSDIDFLVEFINKKKVNEDLDFEVFLNHLFLKNVEVISKNNINEIFKEYILNKSYKEVIF